MSAHNPFRDPGETTSTTISSQASSSNHVEPFGPPPPLPFKSRPQRSSSVGIPGTEREIPESDSSSSSRSTSPRHGASSQHSRPTSQSSRPSAAELQEILRAESPPPYTPTADPRQGETTVEFGPRRPWGQTQQPRLMPPAVAPWQASQRTGSQGSTSGWSGYPGTLQRQSTGATRRVPPPPQHPLLSPPRASFTSQSAPSLYVPPPPEAVSDFARDFYAAGPADAGGLLGGGSSQYAPPQIAVNGGQYAPPQGPPPRVSPNGPPAPPPRPTSGSRNATEVPDDGRPTSKPVPGHPLLNSGKVLVYPAGYECSKCHNTGYKHLDPSHPCSKCWQKYAKAFAGPLTYAPWSSRTSESGNFQRPLPSLPTSPAGAPNHRPSNSLSGLPPPPQHASITRSASTSRNSGYFGSSYAGQPSGIPMSNGGFLPTAPYLSPLHRGDVSPVSGPSTQYTRAPPPGATVVQPGDPRIGGHLCWRCGGKGTTSFLIFDVETCGVCNGLGRTF